VKCLICTRQARGLGHSDNRFKVGESRRYPMDWVFCSRRCQDAFHALYSQWLRTNPRLEDVLMLDITRFEQVAMRQCLRFFGEAAGDIGFAKPLGQYSEREALAVIEAIVSGWTQSMVAHHESAKYPAVRGLASYETQPARPVVPAAMPSAGRV